MVMTMQVHAQGVGINTDGTAPDGSALLDVKSPASGNQLGMLIPRVSLATLPALTAFPGTGPATYLQLVNTNASYASPLNSFYNKGIGMYMNFGTPASPLWRRFLTSADSTLFWGLRGNAGTNPANDYIGTSDAQNVSIRANGILKILVPQAANGTMTFSNFSLADFSALQGVRVPHTNTSGSLGIRFFSSGSNGGLFSYSTSSIGIKTSNSGGSLGVGMLTSFSNEGVRIQSGAVEPSEPVNSRLDVDGNIYTRSKTAYSEYANTSQQTFLNEIHWNGTITSGSDSPQLLTEGTTLTIVVRRQAVDTYFLRIATSLNRTFTCIDQASGQIVSVNPGGGLAPANRVPINFTNDILAGNGVRTIFIKEPSAPNVTYQVTLLVLDNVTTVMIKRFQN